MILSRNPLVSRASWTQPNWEPGFCTRGSRRPSSMGGSSTCLAAQRQTRCETLHLSTFRLNPQEVRVSPAEFSPTSPRLIGAGLVGLTSIYLPYSKLEDVRDGARLSVPRHSILEYFCVPLYRLSRIWPGCRVISAALVSMEADSTLIGEILPPYPHSPSARDGFCPFAGVTAFSLAASTAKRLAVERPFCITRRWPGCFGDDGQETLVVLPMKSCPELVN